MSKKNISIHGSCVSRDVFNYVTKEDIEIKNYIARQSILSAVSKPFKCDITDIGLNSKFQENLVFYDLNKLLFKKLKENKSEILIIDCIDERFNLIKCNESLITFSNELQNSRIIDNIKYEMIKRVEIEDNIIETSIDKYLNQILEIYEEKNIIIHEAYFMNKYKDKEKNIKDFDISIRESNSVYNKILYKFYKYIQSKIPNAHVIDISHKYSADENNRWGLTQYHYEDDYYKHILNIINNI